MAAPSRDFTAPTVQLLTPEGELRPTPEAEAYLPLVEALPDGWITNEKLAEQLRSRRPGLLPDRANPIPGFLRDHGVDVGTGLVGAGRWKGVTLDQLRQARAERDEKRGER